MFRLLMWKTKIASLLPIRHLLVFSNSALGSHHCFLVLTRVVNSVLIMQIEDDYRECVDKNYLKDACHLTAIILHLSSEKIVQNMFRKMFSKFKMEKSQYSTNIMQRMTQTVACSQGHVLRTECHNLLVTTFSKKKSKAQLGESKLGLETLTGTREV